MENGLRVLFLINPSAGGGQALHAWRSVKKYLNRIEWSWTERHSRASGELIRLARQAAKEDWDRIIVLGGDGSMHEVVNGLLMNNLPSHDLPPVALIPCGSGNDWARTWGYPRNIGAWFRTVDQWAIQGHAAGTLSFHRDGRADHSYFINVAGLAYDAWLVRQIEEDPASKGHSLIYILRILRNLFTYRPQQAMVRSRDQSWTGRFYTINAGICPFSGGGMRVVPHADPSGLRMAITLAGDLPVSRILLNIWRFYTGSIGRVRDVTTFHDTFLEIESRDTAPIYVEADGEWKGECPCALGILPGAFRVWAPVRSSGQLI